MEVVNETGRRASVTLISVLMLTRQRGRVVSAPGLIFRDPSSSPALTTRGIRYGYMINCLLPVEFISVVCFIGLFKLSSVLNMSCPDDVLDKGLGRNSEIFNFNRQHE